MAGHVVKAKYAGQTYEIPDIWLAGFMSRHPGITVLEVVRWWHEQAEMEKQWQAQQAASVA